MWSCWLLDAAELTDHEYDRLEVHPETYDIQIADAGRFHGMGRFSGSETDLANLAHALAAYAGAGGWELANAVSRLLHVEPPASSVPSVEPQGAMVYASPVTQVLGPMTAAGARPVGVLGSRGGGPACCRR